MKRLFCVILAMVLMMSFAPCAFGEEVVTSGTCGDELVWSFEDGVLTISGSGKMDDMFYQDGFKGENWHFVAPWQNLEVKEVIIEEGVTSIGDSAFQLNKELKKAILPKSLKGIGMNAFYTTALKEVECEAELEYVYMDAFKRTPFYDVTLEKEGEVYVGTALLKVKEETAGRYEFKDGTTVIEEGAFENSKITEITIPESVIKIGADAFRGCTEIDEIIVPKTVKTIGSYAFVGCTGLKKTVIESGETKVGSYTFENCSALEEVSLPYGLGKIPWSMFRYCEALKNIELPKSVKEIGFDAFEYCTSLESIDLTNVEDVGFDSFAGCKALERVNFGNKLKYIRGNAFAGCDSLKKIVIPKSVGSIGEEAFRGCEVLYSVKIGNERANIASNSFDGTPIADEKNAVNGVIYIGNILLKAIDEKLPETYYIKRGTKNIAAYAFRDCKTQLSRVYMPDSVEVVGHFAFYGCGKLTAINLSKSLKEIPNKAFYCCIELEEIEIPEGVTIIGESAFYNCRKLKKVTLHEGLETISDSVFEGCKSLTEIFVPASVSKIGSRGLGLEYGLIIYCYEGSKAHAYANYNNRMDYRFVD